MFTYYYMYRTVTHSEPWDTLEEAMERVAGDEAALSEYGMPICVIDDASNIVWDDSESMRKLGLRPTDLTAIIAAHHTRAQAAPRQ